MFRAKNSFTATATRSTRRSNGRDKYGVPRRSERGARFIYRQAWNPPYSTVREIRALVDKLQHTRGVAVVVVLKAIVFVFLFSVLGLIRSADLLTFPRGTRLESRTGEQSGAAWASRMTPAGATPPDAASERLGQVVGQAVAPAVVVVVMRRRYTSAWRGPTLRLRELRLGAGTGTGARRGQ